MALAPFFKKSYYILAGAGAFYVFLLLVLSNEFLQRHALYAHKLKKGGWNYVNHPEKNGFAKNQVTPFFIPTSDGESLYAWHVLPLGTYAEHEAALLEQPEGPIENITSSLPFDLLSKDPESRLVINFHGNAGHVAQGWRPSTYHSLTGGSTPKTHVLAFDYRGFGQSSGVPSEAGLIRDGISVVTWAMTVAEIPPERIVILGQSLGTAVSTAVAEHFATQTSPQVSFAGVVLVAGFSDLATLMRTYSYGGIIPMLSPLRPYPRLQKFFIDKLVDTWRTSSRLANLVAKSNRLRLHLVHAKDDMHIPWIQSQMLFATAANAMVEADARGAEEEAYGVPGEEVVKKTVTTDLGNGGYIDRLEVGEKSVRVTILRRGGKFISHYVLFYIHIIPFIFFILIFFYSPLPSPTSLSFHFLFHSPMEHGSSISHSEPNEY
ncbi:alpha/beta-hydrolase [Xylona heveae TC161]|uniref:Alpha/beta-hydrolase n=1 Tax=Xylona heveae (strain CBS 132557 / TC161) TaxID=1328760 RepID=A0A165JH46_XYLHT|nr:alpha/beta-hydrolase [Xylona heveae TC161]KZF26232.1 alpha/beta-hydrolase [Xylona heveae TC161]